MSNDSVVPVAGTATQGGHTVAITTGRDGQWVAYCAECSDAIEEWVFPCSAGGWQDVPPKTLMDASPVVAGTANQAEPSAEWVEQFVADHAHVDIRPECIRQAGEDVEYLTALAKSWIVNGDERHGPMLQCLCLAFGFQQTEIERLRIENINLKAGNHE